MISRIQNQDHLIRKTCLHLGHNSNRPWISDTTSQYTQVNWPSMSSSSVGWVKEIPPLIERQSSATTYWILFFQFITQPLMSFLQCKDSVDLVHVTLDRGAYICAHIALLILSPCLQLSPYLAPNWDTNGEYLSSHGLLNARVVINTDDEKKIRQMFRSLGGRTLPIAKPRAGDVGEGPAFCFSIVGVRPALACHQDGRVLGWADQSLLNRWFIRDGSLPRSWQRQTRSSSEHQ